MCSLPRNDVAGWSRPGGHPGRPLEERSHLLVASSAPLVILSAAKDLPRPNNGGRTRPSAARTPRGRSFAALRMTSGSIEAGRQGDWRAPRVTREMWPCEGAPEMNGALSSPGFAAVRVRRTRRRPGSAIPAPHVAETPCRHGAIGTWGRPAPADTAAQPPITMHRRSRGAAGPGGRACRGGDSRR